MHIDCACTTTTPVSLSSFVPSDVVSSQTTPGWSASQHVLHAPTARASWRFSCANRNTYTHRTSFACRLDLLRETAHTEAQGACRHRVGGW